jgi:hypothetical protein
MIEKICYICFSDDIMVDDSPLICDIFDQYYCHDCSYTTIIRGFGDIISNSKLKVSNSYMFNNFNKDNYWIVMGRGSDEMILQAMSDIECEVDMEGEYKFNAILKWVPGDYDERGCPTMRDYLEVEHIDFNFIQTFKRFSIV